jgi:hypothetical protein
MIPIRKIEINIIPHNQQRYDTVGDYFFDENGTLQIKVSEMKDLRYCHLVAVHELVEVLLTEQNGISEDSITKFDVDFEENRQPENIDEPGDDPKAPYVNEHCIATSVERLMCALLGLKWKTYDKAVLDCGNGTEYTQTEYEKALDLENTKTGKPYPKI